MVANIQNVSTQGLRQEDCFVASPGFKMNPCFKRGKNPPLFILKADLQLQHLSDSLWRVLMYILLSLPPWPICLALTTFYTICAHCLLGLHWVFSSQTSKTGPSLSLRSPPYLVRVGLLLKSQSSLYEALPLQPPPLGSSPWPISNISSDPKSFLIPSSIPGKIIVPSSFSSLLLKNQLLFPTLIFWACH